MKNSLKVEDDLDSILDQIDGGQKTKQDPKPKPAPVAQNKFKLQEDDNWNVPAVTNKVNSANGSRKSQQDLNDAADRLLEDLEEKKPAQRPKTASNNEGPLWTAGRSKTNIY